MAFYAFDQCPDESIERIAEIAESYNLIITSDSGEIWKRWNGCPFEEHPSLMVSFTYSANAEGAPLRLTTYPASLFNHNNVVGLKKIVRELFEATKSTKIMKALTDLCYDLKEFE